MLTENILLKEELAERRGAPRIIGEDARLRQVVQQLHRASGTDATVLPRRGERYRQGAVRTRGSRAEPARDGRSSPSTARRFRRRCSRASCSATRRGIHGCRCPQTGRFELAHRGTLFLDEIGDLPLTLQAKILRALEEKAIRALFGGTQSLHVDVRVVAATNRNLKVRVAERQFRRRILYFRLSVFPIHIPPSARAHRRRDHPRAPVVGSVLTAISTRRR
jgi:transcriptional regulator with GAF, ATPase, and Fis domain